MCSLLSSYEGGNRYYWELPEGLPIASEIVVKNFELLNESWKYLAYYSSENEMLWIVLNCISSSVASFSVQFGIINDFQEKIFESKANTNMAIFAGMNLISRSKLDLLKLKNKSLYLFIEIEAENKEKALKRENKGKAQKMKASKRKLEKDYEDLLLNGIHSDITIKVKRKKFMCHRGILSLRSEVFSAMLKHDMKERVSSTITIEDVDPTTFQDFLIYLYKGSSDDLKWKNVTDLYKLGDKYFVEDLKSLCVEQMKRDISTKNFYEFFLLSQQCNDSELTDITIQFFLKNWEDIMESENWLILLSENPVESTVLIKAFAKNKYKDP